MNAIGKRIAAPRRTVAGCQGEHMALIHCEECGAEISSKAKACVRCGAPLAAPDAAMTVDPAAPLASPGVAAYTPAVLAIALGLVGGIIGFVVRPSIPLLGQLPFNVVIRDGAGLTGLSTLLQPAAHQSFELLLGGTVVGAILGLLTGLALKAQRG